MRTDLAGKTDDEIGTFIATGILSSADKLMKEQGFTADQMALALFYALAKFQRDNGVNAVASLKSRLRDIKDRHS
jgi:hypothetical protein